VHNGIEYGIEQILCEAYDLMKRSAGLSGLEMADVFDGWNQLEELSSYLVEITEVCLRTRDPEDGGDLVEKILDVAGQKGTGLWTVVSALEMGIAVPTIYAALNGRVMSSLHGERQSASSVIEAPPAPPTADLGALADGLPALRDAVILACIASYAQGMALMVEASALHDYNLQLSSIAQIWKGGCIIRARLLQRIQNAYDTNPQLTNLMVDPVVPPPRLNSRLARLAPGGGRCRPGRHSRALPEQHPRLHRQLPQRPPAQNLLQAMRDCFGAHTYQRVDQPGSFHTEWLL